MKAEAKETRFEIQHISCHLCQGNDLYEFAMTHHSIPRKSFPQRGSQIQPSANTNNPDFRLLMHPYHF